MTCSNTTVKSPRASAAAGRVSGPAPSPAGCSCRRRAGRPADPGPRCSAAPRWFMLTTRVGRLGRVDRRPGGQAAGRRVAHACSRRRGRRTCRPRPAARAPPPPPMPPLRLRSSPQPQRIDAPATARAYSSARRSRSAAGDAGDRRRPLERPAAAPARGARRRPSRARSRNVASALAVLEQEAVHRQRDRQVGAGADRADGRSAWSRERGRGAGRSTTSVRAGLAGPRLRSGTR